MNLFAFAEEQKEKDVLKRTTDEPIYLGDAFKLEVEDAFLEADSVSVMIPDGLVWVEEEGEEDKFVTYDPPSDVLILEDLQQTQSFSLLATASGSFELKATVHTENAPDVSNTFAINVMIPKEEVEQPSEEDAVEESPDNEVDEEPGNDEPTVPEDEDEKTTGPEEDLAEETKPEEQPEHEQPIEEETTPEEQLENDHLPETTPPNEETIEEDSVEESEVQPEESLVKEPKETETNRTTQRTQTMVETANVNTIPAPPVGGPNVGDLFTFAGDTNVAQHSSRNVRVLADGTRNKASAMWFNEKIDLSKSFQTSMYLYINGSTATNVKLPMD
ncbi:hypothetical protein [Bacillus sp. JCM 19041]|uniref:lectin-like domain-containing protein n=1 Tax=Bacillus sp. JCM 19041 TaxID=1460637 RepID=UPI0006CFEFFC